MSLSYSFIMKGQLHYIAWYDLEHGECKRVRITQEKDMFDAVDGLLHAKPYTQAFDEMILYQAQYPHDHYSDVIFISPEVPETVITSFAEMRADNKQMICISNRKNKTESPDTLLQSLINSGIGIWPIDAGNIRSEMEELGSVL